MAVYYNEHDPKTAAWLRALIAAGAIPEGDVDERSIVDVRADDVRSYTTCHWFAGIGGWAYALRLANWPDDRPVWTGSCPCQPFSGAGTRKGGTDDRHLWPHWARLIRECQPVAIFGEQVESAIGHGWLDRVFDDLEREGYACGAACLPAASVGAYHRRQRLWFVAERLEAEAIIDGCSNGGLCETGGLADTECAVRRARTHGRTDDHADREVWAQSPSGCRERGAVDSFWADVEWIPCRDGQWRPTQPGLFPLAHGVPARVGRLRGYGNAIVPQVAAAFIAAYLDD